MAITRREFLARAGWASAGVLGGPSLFGGSWLQRATAATIGDRYLVVLQLEGGNDGLNTIVPYDNGSGSLRDFYEVARLAGSGGLRIPADDLAVSGVVPLVDPNSGAQLGFHPGLATLRDMYDQGRVAVIQGCGYPEYSLSHEQSRIAWQTANPLGATGLAGTGWTGRHLAAEYGLTDIPAVSISGSVALEFRQVGTNVLATPRFRGFGFPFDDYDPSDEDAYRAALLALQASASASSQSALAQVGAAGRATMEATDNFSSLHALYEADRASFDDQYRALNSSTSSRLREVAKAIYGVRTNQPGVASRFFHVENGGYDTHSNQGAGESGGQHHALLAEIGDALSVFYADLDDMGVADRTLTVVWSEFSRRIEQNENGTDHGSQGPMFVIGPVNGGIYGNHPDIDPLALDDRGNTHYSQDAGNGYRSTDFRDVYGTILKHWLNVDPITIVPSMLPLDSGPAAEYWTIANLDLGFL